MQSASSICMNSILQLWSSVYCHGTCASCPTITGHIALHLGVSNASANPLSIAKALSSLIIYCSCRVYQSQVCSKTCRSRLTVAAEATSHPSSATVFFGALAVHHCLLDYVSIIIVLTAWMQYRGEKSPKVLPSGDSRSRSERLPFEKHNEI
jgi:hypothetical protein